MKKYLPFIFLALFIAEVFAEATTPTIDVARAESESMRERLPLVKLANPDDKTPIFIKANSLSLDTKRRVFTYKGAVEIWRDDLLITANRVVGNYNEANRIDTIECLENVVITKGADLRTNSNRALYRIADGTVELTEGPELINRENALTADKVTLFLNEDRSEAEGDVRVKVVKNQQAIGGESASKRPRTDDGLKGILDQ